MIEPHGEFPMTHLALVDSRTVDSTGNVGALEGNDIRCCRVDSEALAEALALPKP